MNKAKILILLFITLAVCGCANPSIVHVNTERIEPLSEAIIFIPRFEGNPNFVEESTDYFISSLDSKIDNRIIQGTTLRTETTDVISGGNIAPMEHALKTARAKGAGLLVLGKVTSHNTAGMLNGFSTIRVINVNTGEKLANFHRPSGLLFAHSEHQCVMAAVRRTAKDLVAVLR